MFREHAQRHGVGPVDVVLAGPVAALNLAVVAVFPWSAQGTLVPLPTAAYLTVVVLVAMVALFRRRYARAVAGTVAAVSLVAPTYFVGVAAYAVGAYGRNRWRDWVLVVALVVTPYIGSATWRAMPTIGDQAFGAATTLGLALLGGYVGARRRLLAEATGRAEQAEREQTLRAEQARAEERVRLAAEMHDVVTHRINLIVLRAGALTVDTGDAAAVRRAAEDVRMAGCQALAELRDVVGVLRSGDGGGGGPGAGSDDGLADLVAGSAAGAGIDARLVERGDAEAVCAVVHRTLHRVVRESLTNAAKHAPGARATVEVDYEGRRARAVVRNEAPAPTPPVDTAGLRAVGGGVGLAGLRYRVEVLGGTLAAGPTADGGFAVTVDLPDATTPGERS